MENAPIGLQPIAKQADEMLLALIKASSDVIYMMSPDWETMTELYGRGFLADTVEPDPNWLDKYIHPADHSFVKGVIQGCIRDKRVFELEHRVLRLDGSVGWTFSRAIPILNESGDIRKWFGAASDITPRKEAEEARRRHAEELEAKEKEYLEIIDSSSEGSFIHDLVRDEIYFSTEWKIRLGMQSLSPAQAAKLLLSVVHPADLDGMQGAYEDAVKRRLPKVKMTFRVKTNEGYIWVLGQGKIIYNGEGIPVKYFGTHMDITEQKNAEERLAYQSYLLNEVYDAVFATDMNFKITYWNAAAERTYGWTVEEALGQNADDLFRPEASRACRDDSIRKLIAGETLEAEVSYARKDGARFSVVIKSALLRDKNGSPIGTVGVIRDITERKKAEEEVARLFSEIEGQRCLLEDILEQMPVGVSVFDLHGVSKLSNGQMKTYMPQKIPSIDRKGMKQWHSVDDRGNVLPRDQWPGQRAMRGERVVPGIEFTYTDEGDRKKWILVSAVPMLSKGGDIVGGISSAQDITEHKKIEEELRRSEEKYRILFDSIDEGFCIVEVLFDDHEKPLDYRFLEVNESFERQTGLIDAAGRRMRDMAPNHEQHWFDIYGRIALTGEPARFQNPAKELGRFYDVYAFRIGEPQQRRVAILFHDIAERKRTEEILKRSEERFRAVQDNSLDRFTILKPFRNDRGEIVDFTYVYQNARAALVTGKRPNDSVGLRVTENWPAFPQTHFFSIYKRVAETGKGTEFEDHTRSNGVDEWIRATVTPIPGGIAIATQVITERKQAENALQESEKRYRAVVQNTSAVILRVDLQGIIRFANKRALELFGYAEDELVGKRVVGTIVPARETTGRDLVDMVRDVIENPECFHCNANENMRKGGERIWMEWINSGIYDANGRLKEILGVGFDATERKRAEEALRESEERARSLVAELKRADQNKNQFISALSHEIRNPLAVISAGLEILGISRDQDQVGKAREIINRQMGQLCALVDDLLDLTRISNNKVELKIEFVELNGLVSSIAEDQRALFVKKNILLQIRLGARAIHIGADPVRIKQIVGNLLHNAQKYTQEGGEVVVSVYRKNGEAVIGVRDNGMGLSPELMPRLFQPFVQADQSLDRSGGGLGLGLSITKGIAELHGGSVSAYSEGLGKGSEFVIRLPLSGATDDEKENETVQSDPGTHRQKILVIEDNKDFAELLCAMLRTIGYQIVISHDGNAGVEKAKQFRPDIIICDIGLPGMNGYEVAEAIRSDPHLQNAYLVALTGYAGKSDVARAEKSGFHTHIAKPVNLASLKKLLSEYDSDQNDGA